MVSDTQAQIDENDLERVIHAFYDRVRADDLLGPVFNGAIADWDHHLGKLQAFWSSVMLGTGRYHGRPMEVHFRHELHMTPDAFGRWLSLWRETTDALLPRVAAAALQEKADRIAESLSLGIAFQRERGKALQ